jgi:hypothetical protein
MKILKLTATSKVLTREAEERLNATDFDEPKCSNGNTREYYESMGLRIPQDLLDAEKEFDELEDEDFEVIRSSFRLPVTENTPFFYIESDDKDTDGANTVVFVVPAYTVRVLETVEEIDELINKF